MRHSKISKPPGKHGKYRNYAIRLCRLGSRVICIGHGQIARERFCVFHNDIKSAGHMPAEQNYGNQRGCHDHTLYQVCCRSGQKPAQCRIRYDNDSTDNHGCQVINAKQCREQLSAGSKSACCIRDKKDDNHKGSDAVEHVFIMIPFGKEIRNRNGSNLLAVAAYFFGNKKPVQPGAERKADGSPCGIADAGKVGNARKPH